MTIEMKEDFSFFFLHSWPLIENEKRNAMKYHNDRREHLSSIEYQFIDGLIEDLDLILTLQ
jgi:hypothetical protein